MADPSYVITSHRVDVAGDCPLIVTVADIARITVPAVGYEGPVPEFETGMTTAFTVSPVTRDAVNELKLKRGDEAVAIIKSTEVMICRTEPR